MASTNVGNAYVTVSARFDKSWSSGVITKANAIGDLISKGIQSAMGAVSSSIDRAVSRVDTMNNFPRIMENMGISSEAAKTAIDALSKGIDGLPTALDTAVLGVERFTSKNGDVGKSTDYFLALNDAILAGGASSELQSSAVEQLSQSYAKGKMDMMEWRSLQQAMPAQLNQIAKAMGKTTDELGEGLRNGEISMDSFMDTIVELDKEGGEGFASFADQAKSATGGIGTALANVQNRVSKAVAGIIDAIGAENISGAINAISSRFKDIAQPVIDFIESFKSNFNFNALVAEMSPFLGVFEQIGSAVRSAASNLGELFANVMTVGAPVFKALGAIIAGSFAAAINVVDTVAKGLNALFDQFDLMQMGWDRQTTAIAASGKQLDGYVQTIEELTAKEELNTVEQEKLKQAVEGYNKITGDSVEITDAATGELSKSTDEIKRNAEAWLDNAYAQAYQQQVADIIADTIQKQQELTVATEELTAAQKLYEDAMAHPEYGEKYIEQVTSDYENAKAKVIGLTQGIEENNQKLAEAEERVNAADQSLVAYIDSNSTLKAKLKDVGLTTTQFANYLSSIGKSEKDLEKMSPKLVDGLMSVAKSGVGMGEQVGAAMTGIQSVSDRTASLVMSAFKPVSGSVANDFAGAESAANKSNNAIASSSSRSASNSASAWNGYPAKMDAMFATARSYSANRLLQISKDASSSASSTGAAFKGVPSTLDAYAYKAYTNASNWFGSIPGAASSAANSSVNPFSGLGSRISRAMGNIHFPTPHLAWEEAFTFGNITMRLPHIEWYAKGGFVSSPTVIAGERGTEMVLPKSGGLMDDFAAAVTEYVGTDEVVAQLVELKDELGGIIAEYAPTSTPRELRRINRKVAAYA